MARRFLKQKQKVLGVEFQDLKVFAQKDNLILYTSDR
jgi:hypothetical protein